MIVPQPRYHAFVHCKNCHYPLETLTMHRCPECGRAFDPDDVRTFDVPLPAIVREMPKSLGWATLAVMAFVVAALLRLL